MRWLSRLLGLKRAEEKQVLTLGDSPPWQLSCTRDLPLFLRALKDWASENSVLYLEGVSTSGTIGDFLRQHPTKRTAAVAVGTIWPRPDISHMEMNEENLEGLAMLAEHAAFPEIACHIHVYREDMLLLQWYDAPFDPILLSGSLAENDVRRLAERLGVTYVRMPPQS